MARARIHIGLGLGRIGHWHDGLGEFSRQLGLALAAEAPRLAEERGWRLHVHLPRRWHGVFGDAVGYLDTHTTAGKQPPDRHVVQDSVTRRLEGPGLTKRRQAPRGDLTVQEEVVPEP